MYIMTEVPCNRDVLLAGPVAPDRMVWREMRTVCERGNAKRYDARERLMTVKNNFIIPYLHNGTLGVREGYVRVPRTRIFV